MPTRIDNHAARAKKRLLAQFKEAPNLTGLLARFGARYQAIDDAAYDILTAFTLDDATGDQLDLYGEVLSEARLGRTDNAYRVALKIRIVKNISKGEIPRLLQVYKYLMGAERVAAMETYPATLWLVAENQTVSCEEEADIITAMNEIKAGGVQLLVGRSTGSLAFAFDGGDGLGFGEGDFADGLRTVCPVPASGLLFSASLGTEVAGQVTAEVGGAGVVLAGTPKCTAGVYDANGGAGMAAVVWSGIRTRGWSIPFTVPAVGSVVNFYWGLNPVAGTGYGLTLQPSVGNCRFIRFTGGWAETTLETLSFASANGDDYVLDVSSAGVFSVTRNGGAAESTPAADTTYSDEGFGFAVNGGATIEGPLTMV